ncbi:epoxide hydrolase family protein [Kribbella kalugense]|uniref:Pimeloyl-ACP methyl ester carboxylesterase n=1 Tax=Kribbella kalugense TaxID=2512221 RepID=A0A4R7ZVA4_9ACTN|nr:epoxide hydrolase family protein [Kribbella kalugense]TDW22037.1 pimeloyl-ACP methyl ester carboxylesterase [Kribbella kalugense]
MNEIKPYRIDVPQAELDDLRERLERVRWADEVEGAGWDYGSPVDELKSQVDYWKSSYDWRIWEARLNEYPQFTTTIDGQNIHFLQVKSPQADALPLILTHGWPGSVAEFLDIIEPLTDPVEGDLAFDLVIPSLPGFGFSGPTSSRGWSPHRIAAAWAELMRMLGYERYGAVGNDWGSDIAPELGRVAPAAVVGAHVTQIFSNIDPAELDPNSPEERAAIEGLEWFQQNMDAYDYLQSQQPQSLAHALTDSPAGLLGWHNLIYRGGLDLDFVLTNVMIHWLTRTVASAMRIYYENGKSTRPTEPTTVPLGLAQFRDDTQAIRRFAERDHANIVSWNVYDTGGHFAAHQEPDLLVNDLRTFFTQLD